MFTFKTLTLIFLVLSATAAFAKPPFLKVFLQTYKVNPNSELGKARCLTCHETAPPRRNAYGLDVLAAMHAANSRQVTPEILKSIDKKDSDHDGFSNIAEIKAGTLPGDNKSKPVKSAMNEASYGWSAVTLTALGCLVLLGKKRSA